MSNGFRLFRELVFIGSEENDAVQFCSFSGIVSSCDDWKTFFDTVGRVGVTDKKSFNGWSIEVTVVLLPNSQSVNIDIRIMTIEK
jgi:hypothetical protein